MEKLDFYLEGLTESSYNTKFIKTKREIHTNICFHVRENSTQLFYEYKIDKINQTKAFLKCRVAKCNAKLNILFSESIATKKIGSVFKFCDDLTLEKLLDSTSYDGLQHKCSKWCSKRCVSQHICNGYNHSRAS